MADPDEFEARSAASPSGRTAGTEPGGVAVVGNEPEQVNLSTPAAKAYWARHFQVTAEQIENAVRAVGDEPQRVAAHLGKPWPYDASGIV